MNTDEKSAVAEGPTSLPASAPQLLERMPKAPGTNEGIGALVFALCYNDAREPSPAAVIVCWTWTNRIALLLNHILEVGELSLTEPTVQKWLSTMVTTESPPQRNPPWREIQYGPVHYWINSNLSAASGQSWTQKIWRRVHPRGRVEFHSSTISTHSEALSAFRLCVGENRWDNVFLQEVLNPKRRVGEPLVDEQESKNRSLHGDDTTALSQSARLQNWAAEFGLLLGERGGCFNLILEGVPGTGKTYSLSALRDAKEASSGMTPSDQKWMSQLGQGRFAMTMHPATSYEDFVEGLRPGEAPALQWNRKDMENVIAGTSPTDAASNDTRWYWDRPDPKDQKTIENPEGRDATDTPSRHQFTVHDGFFIRVCREAVHFPDKTFVVLLEEINRCNIPKVMGDLLTTLEPSKRARWVTPKDDDPGFWDTSTAQVVTLPYSQRSFFVPDNIIVVGTMNTTDRSVAPMDAALRRRFAFARVYPLGFSAAGFVDGNKDVAKAIADLEKAVPLSWKLWKALNEYLQTEFGDDAMLGHSYLHALKDALAGGVEAEGGQNAISRSHWNLYIFPQLIDVLVSNDLVDQAIATEKSSNDQPRAVQEKCFEPSIIAAAKSLGELQIMLRGVGLLRTPSIRFAMGSSTDHSVDTASSGSTTPPSSGEQSEVGTGLPAQTADGGVAEPGKEITAEIGDTAGDGARPDTDQAE